MRGSEARLEEAAGLARAIDLTIAQALVAPVSQIRPATYLGKGKVEEIVGLIAGQEIELVVMDCALSPIQQRNLEKAWNTKGSSIAPGLFSKSSVAAPRPRKARCRSSSRI